MDFKNFLTKDPLAQKELYWALVIESGWIQAGIWEIEDGKAGVIAISPSTQWETDADLVGAADTVLSAAVQNLAEEEKEPTKTVFGVPSSWVENGQIKKEILDKIKKICTDLSLEPAGFVVIPEAVAHYYKSLEGVPFNAVLLGFGREDLEVSVFKMGNLVGTASIARSVSIVDDVIEGLARFAHKDTLPSRFLIYDGKEGELEDDRQELLDAEWEGQEKIKFLHTPKVEIIEANNKVLATALAGASEIAKVAKIEIKKEGFVDEKSEDENLEYPKEQISPEDLGFVVGEDVAKKPTPKKIPEAVPSSISQSQIPVTVQETGFEEKPNFKDKLLVSKNRLFSNIVGIIKKVKSLFQKVPSNLSKGFSEKTGKKTLVFLGITLVIFLFGGFLFWWYYPKAAVIVYVLPKKLEDRLAITVDLDAKSADFGKFILPGKILKTEVSAEKTKATSGTKTIGEKARGSVTVQNGTAASINLTATTLITSSNNLQFSLDKFASVSAALSPTMPGTALVDVTAVDIGAEYNLAKGETFKIGNYPKAEVDAISSSDFSGGSSRQIAAVSAEDAKLLEKDLTNELLDKAKSNFLAGLTEDNLFVEEAMTATASSREFSSKVGDEASDLKLSLGLTVIGLSLDKTQLFDISKEYLKNKIPSGYVLENEQLTARFVLKKTKNNLYEFDVLLSADLLPEINEAEIAKNIAGKYPAIAESYLGNILGYGRTEIKRKPRFPGKLGTLPHVAKNISVELSAEK